MEGNPIHSGQQENALRHTDKSAQRARRVRVAVSATVPTIRPQATNAKADGCTSMALKAARARSVSHSSRLSEDPCGAAGHERGKVAGEGMERGGEGGGPSRHEIHRPTQRLRNCSTQHVIPPAAQNSTCTERLWQYRIPRRSCTAAMPQARGQARDFPRGSSGGLAP